MARDRVFQISFGSITLALVVLLAGCGSNEVPNEPVGTPEPPSSRPTDGLLGNPALQQVVDLQVERDGAGLLELLGSEDPAVRARAAFALGSVQYSEAASGLVTLLRDGDSSVRRDAAFALGQLADPLYGPVLLGAFREETDPGVRSQLLEAVGRAGDERVVDDILGLDLLEGEEAPRTLALARLGLRGAYLPTGINHLVQSLSDPDPRVQAAGAHYFSRGGDPGPWVQQANTLRGVLDSIPPSRSLGMQVMLGLALLGDPQDTPRFLWWMENSPDWRVRANAARATGGRTADPRVRQGLMAALEEPSTHVAINAANSLASIEQLPPRERERLKAWVEDHPDQWLRAGPILALLGRLGEGVFLKTWLDQWGETDVIPITRGLGALAFVPGDEATTALLEATDSPHSRILGTALGGLARRWRVDRGDPLKVQLYFDAFSKGLRTGDPAATFVAAPALADSAFLPLGSLALLVDEYQRMTLPDDLEGMQAILRALGSMGTPEAEGFLESQNGAENPALAAAAAAALTRLRGEEPSSGAEAEAETEAQEPDRRVDWPRLAALGSFPKLILETEKGVVTLVLDAENAPLTVQTIAGFAEEGLYDGVPFHRVVPNFVVQGGDFARQDGFGGPGFSIRSEFTQLPFLRGVLGMASAGKDTEGSQFFITHSMQPHLDSGYTAFGWVEEGMDVVDVLQQEDRIVTARVERDPA